MAVRQLLLHLQLLIWQINFLKIMNLDCRRLHPIIEAQSEKDRLERNSKKIRCSILRMESISKQHHKEMKISAINQIKEVLQGIIIIIIIIANSNKMAWVHIYHNNQQYLLNNHQILRTLIHNSIN